MKKNGFTLAEVLITLGIVGVVAAMTLPSLMTDTTAAQIGPKLSKAVSSFEQANQALLSDRGVDTLTDGGLIQDGTNYRDNLSRYLKGSSSSSGQAVLFTTKDGIAFNFATLGGIHQNPAAVDANGPIPPHMQRIGSELIIDINGWDTRPNLYGSDRFSFSLWNDGSLRPKGGTNWNGAASSNPGGAEHWRNKCPANVTPSEAVGARYCAGHIFENNLKVLYK